MLLSATEIISKSWEDYLKNFRHWMIFSLLIFSPPFVVMLAGTLGVFLSVYFPSVSLLTDIIVGILILISWFFSVWSSIALIHAGVKYFKTGTIDPWKEHYAGALAHFWPIIVASFLIGIFVFMGVLALIIPGIMISVWYMFTAICVVDNYERGFAAMSSSKKLVTGRWWAVAWRAAIPTLFFAIAFWILQTLIISFLELLPMSKISLNLLDGVLSSITTSLTAPLATLTTLNLYFNLKNNPLNSEPVILTSEVPVK